MKNTLKVERAKQNITQADLAEKVGVSRQTINSIEIGKYVPSTLLALKIARVFNISVDEIFILEDKDWSCVRILLSDLNQLDSNTYIKVNSLPFGCSYDTTLSQAGYSPHSQG